MSGAMRGLGFVSPEKVRARVLAQLNGSTALPPNAGLPQQGGQMPPQAPAAAPVVVPPAAPPAQMPTRTPSPADVQPLPNEALMAPPSQPEFPEQEAAEPEGRTPKWARIAGAIGHILLSADAGYHGRPMPKYDDPLKAEQDEAMQQAEFLINTTARAWEVARKAPPGQRETMLEQFEGAIKRVAPDFDFRGMMESLQDDGDRIDAIAPQIAMMSPEAKQMFMAAMNARGGDAQAAADLLKDETFMKSLADFEDNRNAPALRFKLAQIQKAMKQLGLSPEDMADLTPENFEALNERLPEQVRLTPSEVASLRRNPQFGAGLGMKTPQTDPDQTLDTRAGIDRRTQPEPGAAAPPTKPRRPASTSPGAAPPSPPARGRSQAKPPAREEAPPGPPREPPEGSREGDPNYVPPGDGPVYGREGWNPALADPATQRELKKIAGEKGLSRDQVQGAITEAGKREGQPPLKRGAEKPGAPPKKAAPPKQASSVKRFAAPRDMVIPGVGKVKKGEVVTYDEATGKYSRG